MQRRHGILLAFLSVVTPLAFESGAGAASYKVTYSGTLIDGEDTFGTLGDIGVLAGQQASVSFTIDEAKCEEGGAIVKDYKQITRYCPSPGFGEAVRTTYTVGTHIYSLPLLQHSNDIYYEADTTTTLSNLASSRNTGFGYYELDPTHLNPRESQDVFFEVDSSDPDFLFRPLDQSFDSDIAPYENANSGYIDWIEFNDENEKVTDVSLLFSIDHLNVQSVPSLPEPASWAMTIGGIGFVGAAMRRKRTILALAGKGHHRVA